MTAIQKNTANYLFNTLAEATDSNVKFRLGDIVDVANITRGVYRVVAGGTGIADGVNYIDLDNGYQLELIYSHSATVDVTDYQATEINSLISSSGITIKSNTIEKTSGSGGWNEQAYSQNFFTGGARVSCQPSQVDKDFMIGLNTDPLTDVSYTSIDYAINADATGTVNIYEAGVDVGAFGSYLVGSLLEVRYDGEYVKYYVDDVLKRSVRAGLGIDFYLDSSFDDLNGKATHIRFEHYFDSTNIDYNATETNTLVASSGMTIKGNTIEKTGGTDAIWDEHVYSQNNIKGGARILFKAAQVDKDFMMGLNTDPMTDVSYTSLDYAFYLKIDGTVNIYESGSQAATLGAYTTDTLFEIVYDGYNVLYYIDGGLQRSTANAYNVTYYFDSSFYSIGARATNINFDNFMNPELTAGTTTYYHYHAYDRDRVNHTGTQTAATISDFDTEVANNSAVTANTAKVSNAAHTGDVTGSTTLTIANDAVTIAKLSATGTPSSATFHRGDDTWTAAIGSASIDDTNYSRAGWNNDTTNAATKNALSDTFSNMVRYLDADTGGVDNVFAGVTENTTNTGDYNTYIGHGCGASNASGERNTGIGRRALNDNLSGNYNVAISPFSLSQSTVASRNIAIGYQALVSLGPGITSEDNIGIGYQSLYSVNDSSAQRNVAVGNNSLFSLFQGLSDTAIGYQSGYSISSGSWNFCGGDYAGYGLTTGHYCCYTGYQTGLAGGTSSYNTAYGAQSMTGSVSSFNTAFGRRAMYLKVGSANVAIGSDAMSSSGSSLGSVGIGTNALQVINGGNYNLAAGHEAGQELTSGDYNVFLGNRAGNGMTTQSYCIYIGSGVTGNSSYQLEIGERSGGGAFIAGHMGSNPWLRTYSNFYINAAGVTTSPPYNHDLLIQATSNTNAQISYKGSDGVVRSGNITLS